MSFHKNQRTLNEVGGNVMAWLAQKHIKEIEALENFVKNYNETVRE